MSEFEIKDDSIEYVDTDFSYATGRKILHQNSLTVQPVGAMVDQPKGMILDEAHSNVDTYTKKFIQVMQRVLMQDKTSFSIAHHLATIRDSANTMVLNGGEIVANASHSEPMAIKRFLLRAIYGLVPGESAH